MNLLFFSLSAAGKIANALCMVILVVLKIGNGHVTVRSGTKRRGVVERGSSRVTVASDTTS